MWAVVLSNLDTLLMWLAYTWAVWFATRHTYGKWPQQWGIVGRPEKLGLNGYKREPSKKAK